MFFLFSTSVLPILAVWTFAGSPRWQSSNEAFVDVEEVQMFQ